MRKHFRPIQIIRYRVNSVKKLKKIWKITRYVVYLQRQFTNMTFCINLETSN